MNVLLPVTLAAVLAAAAAPAAAAGLVEVRFVQPEKFADIGRGAYDRERHLEILARHFKALGEQLPDGQTLTIDVLDVDLAGELKPMRRFGDIRVLNGGVDWPRMSLRWSLAADGRVLGAGEEQLADVGYLGVSSRLEQGQMMAYDVRMVQDWFRQRFAPAAH
jgi:Protein of unknown function (DUF3016)